MTDPHRAAEQFAFLVLGARATAIKTPASSANRHSDVGEASLTRRRSVAISLALTRREPGSGAGMPRA